MIIISKNFKETEATGRELGEFLSGGAVIALSGDLGSGKTTFIKGLAKGLGVKSRITSPTFLIIKKYGIKKPRNNIRNFYHIDCYRVESEQKMQLLGIEEILKDNSAVVAIEWTEKIEKLIPENAIRIEFEWLGKNKRRIFIDD